MHPGDFTNLAEDYAKYRPDYSTTALEALIQYTGAHREGFRVADVGAGTGIWTRMLADRGMCCYAVEPNDAMRAQGIRHTEGLGVKWVKGCAENTGLETESVDWVTMASSFHWVIQPDGLNEFSRVLRLGGFVTVLWNPRNLEGNALQERVEGIIYDLVPDLKRVSSAASKHSPDYYEVLSQTGSFGDVLFVESKHELVMSKERYIGVWRSVNDIQVQAGPERFERLLALIAEEIAPLEEIVIPYKTRCWTARKLK